MTGLRSYGDPCGIARALDVVGERWALLVVRELVYGAKRFSDLRVALGTSPNVLTQRLGELEEAGIVQRRKSGAAMYELTVWGSELHPILVALGRWGARAEHRPPGPLTVDALMLALEATFVGDATDLRGSYELRIGEERFVAVIDPAGLSITHGAGVRPDVVIEADASTLRAVVFGDKKPSALEVHGDLRRGRGFLRAFARP